MFAKLLTLILALGLFASLLLVNRQRRYELVTERMQLHAQITQIQRHIQELRVHLADATSAQAVDALIAVQGHPWRSITGDESEITLETDGSHMAVLQP